VALKAKKLPTYLGEIEDKKEFFFEKCFTFYSSSLILSTFVCYCILWVKGTVPRDFGLQVHESVSPQAPEYPIRAERFAAQGANGKNIQSEKF